MSNENNSIVIRNYQLMKHIFDNLDKLSLDYKLSRNAIAVIQQICSKHNSFNAYILFSAKDFTVSRKCFYRIIDTLEDKKIIKVVSRPSNGTNSGYQVYFTNNFIRYIGEEEFADLYENWLEEQLSYKKEDNYKSHNIKEKYNGRKDI